jgi:RNA polymerase sigma-70 factor (ECF subfamily)
MEIDSALVVRAQKGDILAQEELVATLAPLVFRLAGRFFRSREDVEDLSQETFIRFFNKIEELRPEENVSGWVSRVTINVCYDRLRKLRRERLGMESYRVQPQRSNEPEIDAYESVRSAVNGLDAKLRIPLILKEVEELSINEISDIMGISSSNVKIRLYRARKKLAGILKGHPGMSRPSEESSS